MTKDEFNQWKADLFSRFPAIGQWVRGLGTEESVRGLLGAWMEALVDRDLADCLTVNKLLSVGEHSGPGQFPSDWQILPARVRRLAGELHYDRESRKLREAEAESLVNSKGEPRYRCKVCWDTGRVQVANPSAVRAAANGLPYAPSKFGSACVARCNKCCLGLPHIPTPSMAPEGTPPSKTHPTPIYDPTRHFAVPWDHLDSEETWDRLLLWVMERRNSQRVAGFDAWNQEAHA